MNWVSTQNINGEAMDLFNLYSKAILTQLDVLPGFITGGHSFNKICRWHSVDSEYRKKTVGVLDKVLKGKQEERNKHEF